MIEVTFIEMVLFAWAVLATAAALKYKEDAHTDRVMLITFIEDKATRERMLKLHNDLTETQT